MAIQRSGGWGPLALGLALAAAATGVLPGRPQALAQAPPSPAPPAVTVIPAVETELLRVEAVVLDEAGRPVTHLEARDFVVLEEGQPQPLTHFQRGAAVEAAAAPAADPAAAPTARTGRPGRHIVLA